MNPSSTALKISDALPEFLSGGGEMGERIRMYDWSSTPLGPVEFWPQSLKTCVRIMLTSRQPIWIGWGKELIKLYNDPYRTIVGGKHPWALGRPASEVWKDIWRDIEPMLKTVMQDDEGTYAESQLLIMERNGYPEETYYTFSYTPIPGDQGGTAGMICANTDDTEKITGERQLMTLSQLGKSLADANSIGDVTRKTIDTLKHNPHDFPFALFYTITGDQARVADQIHTPLPGSMLPSEFQLDSETELAATFRQCLQENKMQVIQNLVEKFGAMPTGHWQIPPEKAILLPIFQNVPGAVNGILMIGLNPYRLLNESYKNFFALIADQVLRSFATLHYLQEERKRAEALAEIDRAKTIFFSNISHEFRTPLTLLLGPIEDVLNDEQTHPDNKMRMDVAHRNALRMQKLVNTLLEFSRIEAGRVDGKFSPVEIVSLTRDLASSFRSAIEKAGMELTFSAGEITSKIYVDPDMWEKIVLNLVSNAFKYSREGRIEVRLNEKDKLLTLEVTDTGIGIPADQLERVFDRFHRVDNFEGRSAEGTGIGLAMVKELVKLHHGKIYVSSVLGKGSAFTVTIPVGKDHLPPDKISKTPAQQPTFSSANSYVQEALKWLPDGPGLETGSSAENDHHQLGKNYNRTNLKKRIVLADDNADMRDYITKLLSNQFHIQSAVNGEEAYRLILANGADLLLSDIMMPLMDGFKLLEKVRQNPMTQHIPVIFLSAKAGEEAKVDGLAAGADDYLVKPFSARELMARVDSNIRIAEIRQAAQKNMHNLFMQAPMGIGVVKGRDYIWELANERILELAGRDKPEDLIGKPLFQAIPEGRNQGFETVMEQVYLTGNRVVMEEAPVMLYKKGQIQKDFLKILFEPLREEDGHISGIMLLTEQVTEQVIARKKIEENQKELNELANVMPQLVWVSDPTGKISYYNERIGEFAGVKKNADDIWSWEGMVHPDDRARTKEAWTLAVEKGSPYQLEHRLLMKDGSYRWHLSRAFAQRGTEQEIIKWFGTTTDVQDAREQSAILEKEVAKRTRELNEMNLSLQQSNEALQQFAHVASHDLKEPVRKIKIFAGRLADDPDTKFSDKSITYLQKVDSATDRMFKMIEGVLNYSKINATDEKSALVNLNEVMKNIESDLEILIQQKSARLSYMQLPIIEGVPVQLYQLFYNLVNNSLKFSAAARPPVISISGNEFHHQSEPFTRIEIRDNGIGFAQENAARIFQTFARLNPKDEYEGTGLGLSLCRRIVERHRGRIYANGEKGKGSTFTVELPINYKNLLLI